VIDPALELSLTAGVHAGAGRSVLAELQARAQHLATVFALDQKRATEAEAHKSAHAHAHTHAHAHAPHVREFQSFAVSRKTIRALTPAVPQLCLAAYEPGVSFCHSDPHSAFCNTARLHLCACIFCHYHSHRAGFGECTALTCTVLGNKCSECK
jgi:hypothetical protein